MVSVLKRVSLFYGLLLLGIYVVNKLMIFFELKWTILPIVNRIVILPMGCMTIIFITASVQRFLEDHHIENGLYNTLVVMFGVLLMGVFFFFSFTTL